MKKFFTPMLFLVAFAFCTNNLSGQTVSDTVKPKPIEGAMSGELQNYQSMNNYFFNLEKGFKKYRNGVYLYSVDHDINYTPDPDPKFFRLNYEYLFVLNTHNFSVGLNPWKYDPSKFNAFLSGRVGWGESSTDLFPLNKQDDAKITSSFGLEGEIERTFSLSKRVDFNVFIGVGINWVNPEKYDDGFKQVKNSGTVMDPFFGFRYYIKTSKEALNKISVQVKAGFPFTNGFTYENGNASSMYFGFGVGVTSLQSFSRKSEKGFMALESGILFSTNSRVAYGQFVIPIRVMDNLSIGINGQVGSGYADASLNEQRVSSYYSFGADLRFFAYRYTTFVNPYIGIMRNFYTYNIDKQQLNGQLNVLRIGNNIKLGKNSNWFLDIHVSVPINIDDEWINYTTKRYDSTGVVPAGNWVEQTDSVTLKIPANFDITFGLVYKIRPPAEKRNGKYKAKWDVFKEEEIARLEKPVQKPLPLDADADELVEERIYIARENCPELTPPPIVTDVVPNIDASDIKMLTLTYQSKTDINGISHNLFKTDPQPQDSVVLLLAMFDKERNDTKAIQNANMQLIFTDFNTGKFFGYEYDNNGRLKPSSIDIYREFVKELHWLDNDEVELQSHYISGDQIVEDVFRSFDNKENRDRTYPVNRDNYRFAYAIYPKEAFDTIQAKTNQNFGISINFKYDYDKNFDSDDVLLCHFKKDGNEYVIDENDVSFFSNMVVGSELVQTKKTPIPGSNRPDKLDDCSQKINMGNFSLGSDRLSPEQEIRILDAAKLSLNCNISLILGYTDEVEFMRNAEFMNDFLTMEKTIMNAVSPKLKEEWQSIADTWRTELKSNPKAIPSDELCQRGLSWRRIRTVMEEINKYNLVDMKSIEIKAEGIFDDGTQGSNLPNNPANRKVVIKFTNKNK